MDYVNLMKLAVDYSDGIVQGSLHIDPEVAKYVEQQNVPFLPYQADFDESAEAINALYDNIEA